MKYFFAIFFPPLGVLMTGRFGSFLLNCFLTMMGWFPGIIHALLVIRSHEGAGEHRDHMRMLKDQKELMMAQIEMQQLQHMQRMSTDGAAIPSHLVKRKRTRSR